MARDGAEGHHVRDKLHDLHAEGVSVDDRALTGPARCVVWESVFEDHGGSPNPDIPVGVVGVLPGRVPNDERYRKVAQVAPVPALCCNINRPCDTFGFTWNNQGGPR